jgi:hypothetical protein
MGQSNSFSSIQSVSFYLLIISGAHAHTSGIIEMFTNPAPGAEIYKYATICFISLLIYLAFSQTRRPRSPPVEQLTLSDITKDKPVDYFL